MSSCKMDIVCNISHFVPLGTVDTFLEEDMKINKFFLGGAFILAAVVYLIASSTQASAEYFMTVDELKADGTSAIGKSLRLSGAVMGDTIQYNAETLELTFEVAHVSGDNKEIEAEGGLAEE